MSKAAEDYGACNNIFVPYVARLMSTRVNMAVGRIERQLWVYVKNQGVDTGQIFFTRFERKNTQTYFLLFKGLSDCSANVPKESYEAQEPQDEHKKENNSETA